MEERQSYFSLGATFGYFLLIFVGFQLLVPLVLSIAYLAAGWALTDLLQSADFLIAATLAWQVVSIGFIFWLLARKRVPTASFLRLRRLGAGGIAIILLAFVFATGLIEIATRSLELPPNVYMEMIIRDGNPVMVVLILAILAPISEELVFRGFLFHELEVRYGGWAATIVTALIFTLAHAIQYTGAELALVLFIAIVLGYMRARWQNLALPLGVHFLNNALSYIFYVNTL